MAHLALASSFSSIVIVMLSPPAKLSPGIPLPLAVEFLMYTRVSRTAETFCAGAERSEAH